MRTSTERASVEEVVRIAHTLPGRIRLRVPLLVAQPEVCRRIADRFLQMPNVGDKITVNIVTGSIVIESTKNPIDAEKLRQCVRESIEEELQKLPKSKSGPTKMARAVARAFADLNRDVRGGLHHRADLAILLPVFLATLALGQIFMVRRLPAPAWFNFCWWAFRAFLTFHKDAAAHEDDVSTDAAEPSTSRTASDGAAEKSTSPDTRHSSSPE